MPKVKSSAVWNFFQEKPNSDYLAICNICKNELSYKATSNNLRRHIHRKHPLAMLDGDGTQEISLVVSTENTEEQIKFGFPESMEFQLQQESIDIPSDPLSDSKDQPKSPMDAFLKRKKKKCTVKETNDALLRLFTHDFQPFSIVEDSGFQNFIQTLNPNYQLPSKKTIKESLLPAAYEEAFNSTRNILVDIPSVTLSAEIWTSTNDENLLAITAHFINANFEKKSHFLKSTSLGQNFASIDLSTNLADIINEWNLEEKVLVVISNKASNVSKGVTDLGIQHLGCFAQKLNSIAQEALVLIYAIFSKVRTIVDYFKRSTSTTEESADQKQPAYLLPERLVQYAPTRWNSAFSMLERFVELEGHVRNTLPLIESILPKISLEEWHFLGEIVKILKPLEMVTKIMSEEEYITASSIIILTDGLVDVYSNLETQNFTKSAKELISCITNGLNSKLGDSERCESLVLTTFLDPRFKNIGFSNEITANVAKEQIVALLTQLIQENGEDDACQRVRQEDDLENSIWRKFEEKIATSHPTGNAQSRAMLEVQHYLEEPPISRNDDPLVWWKNNANNLPNLSELVKFKFIPVATAAPCKNLFTKTGQALTDKRKRLSSSKMQEILFLNTMYQ